MTLAEFLNHWGLAENPFLAEEARNDAVFARLSTTGVESAALPNPVFHSDFEKVVGDLRRPSSAIIFGEKGSGKTAMRLQLAARTAVHNRDHPQARVLLIAYDDLNVSLDRFTGRSLRAERGEGRSVLEALQKIRLVDHIDGILKRAVPPLVDAMLGLPTPQDPVDLGDDAKRIARKLDPSTKRELLLLQALYDRNDEADLRTTALRRRLRMMLPWSRILTWAAALLGWLAPIGMYVVLSKYDNGTFPQPMLYAFYALAGLWGLALVKLAVWDRLVFHRLAHKVRKQIRVSSRADRSYARSLRQLDPIARDPATLPLNDSDEPRYAMLDRLRHVLRPFGYTGIIIVLDRVDEPTLISGDPDRMKAVVWPLLNNKFLQQDGIGVKMLLPIELRHILFRESSAFFQEARLDKQNLVERLTWTGAMLYDLANARIAACRGTPRESTSGTVRPLALLDLFAEDVTRQDLVDALDQMHQPRDAFKFLYRCLVEHCSNNTSDQNSFRIPRLVLDQVRKHEADRVQQLYRGLRPA
jgi:hypothetical protein